MRVVLLTHGGAEQFLELLLEIENVKVAAVLIETVTSPRRSLIEKIKRSIRYDGYLAIVSKLARKILRFNKGNREVAEELNNRESIAEAARGHGIPVYFVENYHFPESIERIHAADADLGIIYGTNIIKENVFGIPRLGSINLHKGLAPYYRGGPYVFWELFNDEKEVGLTAHFVAPKVDTGDIILQKTIPLVYDFSYGVNFERFIPDFDSKYLNAYGAKIMVDAVRLIAEGSAPRIQQDISLGKRYRLPIKKEKDEMRRRLRQRRKAFLAQNNKQAGSVDPLGS
jgi:folate-dependent phosphoribosylglycinamide formyltransferase PurN